MKRHSMRVARPCRRTTPVTGIETGYIPRPGFLAAGHAIGDHGQEHRGREKIDAGQSYRVGELSGLGVKHQNAKMSTSSIDHLPSQPMRLNQRPRSAGSKVVSVPAMAM